MKHSSWCARTCQEIEKRIAVSANPDRAVNEKRYLKSQLEFYGSGVPVVRRAVKTTLRQAPPPALAASIELSRELWTHSHHELRLAAVENFCLVANELEPADLAHVEHMLRHARTWALVDPLAIKVVGGMLDHHPQLVKVLDRWSQDGDFWIRRSSLLALLMELRAGRGDFERFEGYADSMLGESEFFIRKAIGWVLREVSKKRPELVIEFLEPRIRKASGVTVREAIRYLDPIDRERLMTAYRSR